MLTKVERRNGTADHQKMVVMMVTGSTTILGDDSRSSPTNGPVYLDQEIELDT